MRSVCKTIVNHTAPARVQDLTMGHWSSDIFVQQEGRVLTVTTMGIQIADRLGILEIGARVEILTSEVQASEKTSPLLAEVIAIGDQKVTALPFGPVAGIRRGDRVLFSPIGLSIRPNRSWLGRVVNGLGQPVDGKGALGVGPCEINPRAQPPMAAKRARLGPRIDFGVKALNAFTPARMGQRLGIFSASGVGKSSLLGMVSRNTDCDIRIITLIGERGREVREFIEDHLGPEGLAKSIIIVATADEPALMRREAGFLAMALSEYFRDGGHHVLCLMDSLTRIAMAQREIGLAAGEPPASQGYTASVFSLLPALLERAGPGLETEDDTHLPGYISGVFTILVEGDDHDEPISDHARAILDGHIVLDRNIAERGRYPSVNILRSLSRTAHDIMSDEECANYIRARQMAALHNDMVDLIRIGAYQSGSNPELDNAIDFCVRLEEFLTQGRYDHISMKDTYKALRDIVMINEQSDGQ